MKRLLFAVSLCLMALVPRQASAALPAKTQFNVRMADGSDANGGMFVGGGTGTNYSRQAAAQFSGTDLVSASGTTNPCSVTSVSHSFISTDVDNGINISSGTNWTTATPIYRIVSVSGGAATLDRACGSVAVLAGGTWAVGGALATIAKAEANTVPGSIVYIKSGTNTITSTYTISIAGNAGTGDIVWEGYGSTPGDLGACPLITTATNSVTIITLTNVTNRLWRNICMSSTAATRGHGFVTSGSQSQFITIEMCVMDGFDRDFFFDNSPVWLVTGLKVIATEMKNSNYGLAVSAGVVSKYNYYHGMAVAGMYPITKASSATFSSYRDVYYNNTKGFSATEGPNGNGGIYDFQNCDFANNTTAILLGGGSANNPQISLVNNAFYGNTTTIDGTNTTPNNLAGVFSRNNAADSGAMINWPALEITLTSDPWVGRTTANYTPNTAPGGGALLIGAGYGGYGLYGAITNKPDVGAVQSVAAASGGSGSFFVQ